ncbi:hypothetical protein [Hydrocoleum sp. CS-953]|nr:hypothetical protein [Hydrocoleum sp. CS-953]
MIIDNEQWIIIYSIFRANDVQGKWQKYCIAGILPGMIVPHNSR